MKRSTTKALDSLDAHWKQWDELQKEKDYACVPRPKGSVIVTEFAAKYGISTRAAGERLQRMVRDGLVRRVRCHAGTKSGIRSVFAYQVVK